MGSNQPPRPESPSSLKPETMLDIWGSRIEVQAEDFLEAFRDYLPSVDHEDVPSYLAQDSSFHPFEAESTPSHDPAAPVNPLASSFSSLPRMKGSAGCASEANTNQESPNFTTDIHAAGRELTRQTNAISATPLIQDDTFPSAWDSLNDTTDCQLSSGPSRTLSTRPLSLPQRVTCASPSTLRCAYGEEYNSDIVFATAEEASMPYYMSKQGLPDQANLPRALATPNLESTAQPVSKSSASLEDGPAEGHNMSFATSQLPGQLAQNNRNASHSPHVSDDNHNHHTTYSTNTPSSSMGSGDSPRSMPAFPSVKSTMPKSTSCPTSTGFKKPALPLTALQMVNEATFQPTMDYVEVTLLHPESENKKVESLDYRDESWQGRSDERTGWTPYVDFADFPETTELLERMRENDLPDTATIFTSLAQVDAWRESERKKACRGHKAQDVNELPQSPEEKAAIVKLLFKAFKTTIEGQSNAQVQRSFEHQVHSNAHVEAVCWQLLEAAIQRSEGSPLCSAYEPEKGNKSATDRNSSFAQRIDDLVHALMWEKSVCNNLLKAPKIHDAVDSPRYMGKRTANNRVLNGKKAEVARIGKKEIERLKGNNDEKLPRKAKVASRPSSRRGKRSKKEFDDDSESTEESPSKRPSPDRSNCSTPSQRFAMLNGGFGGHHQHFSPSSSQLASHKSAPYPHFGSPGPSTTGSVRVNMSGWNLNGIPQPNFGPPTRSIPPSPLNESASLSGVGTQHLAQPQRSTESPNSFLAINDEDEDYHF